jgi:hypothetical protein
MTNISCVYTVLRYSWWWTVDLSETCRVLYQINLRKSVFLCLFFIRSRWWWRFLICRTSHSCVVSNVLKSYNIIKTVNEECVSDSSAVPGKATAALTIRKTQNFVTHWLALFTRVYNLKRSQFTVPSLLYLQTRDVNVKLKKCSYTCSGWKYCREQ